MPNPNNTFTDESTQHVLGTRDFLARLTPDSPSAQQQSRNLPTYFPTDHDNKKFTQEIHALTQTQNWISQNPTTHQSLRAALRELPTLERPLRKLIAQETLRDTELFEIKRFLFHAISALDITHDLTQNPTWSWPADQASKARSLMQTIHPQTQPTPRFHLSSDLSPTLTKLRAEHKEHTKHAREIARLLEQQITAQHGGAFDINNNYQSTLTPEQLHQIPTLHLKLNNWCITSPELQTAQQLADHTAQRVDLEEETLRIQLTRTLHNHIDFLQNLLQNLSTLDIRLAKNRLRTDLNGCWPTWSVPQNTTPKNTSGLNIQQGREPRTEQHLTTHNQKIQPVDIHTDTRPTIIVGPNMGGKSILLKLAGICQWAAQHALPIPAQSFTFSPVNSIIYVGAEEPLAAQTSEGLSSFGREIHRLVQSWSTPPAPRLWLLDELGRGTHPDEGAAIASEIIQKLHQNHDLIIAATHFPAVAALPNTLRLRIRGLAPNISLKDTPNIQQSLQNLMDYTPIPSENAEIPRDARRIALALGLPLDPTS